VFRFPKEFEDPFVSAWKEPFTGFELKWIEVEICRQAMKPTNVTDLFERMKETYPDLADMHQSKFYRIVSSLVDAGYLEDRQEGRAKIIHTLPAGAREFGRITRYFFEIQIERIKDTLWEDMINKVTTITGCFLDFQNVVLGAEYAPINALIAECMHCDARDKPPEDTEIAAHQSKFIFLDYHAIVKSKTENSTIFELNQIDDWIFKDDSIDRVFLFSALTINSSKAVDILNEAKRVITPEGKIIVFEMTNRDSVVLSTLMRQATTLLNISSMQDAWELPSENIERSQLLQWFDDAGLQSVKEFPDVISSIFILEK